ncbi:MAG: 4Fe-4S binding protein [Oscillospiraceae bacterium]|nr:4Fe-4S binding protein [Oscillospiraceae bacterium]
MDLPFVKEAISQLFSKTSCAMYPAVPSEAAPGYRGRIVYHPDRCIACGMCERVCSGNAITRTVEKVEEGDKITLTFNLGSCTFCATCADFCSKDAIELTGDYHMVATKEEDLLVSGTFIKKPPVKKAPAAAPKADAAAKPGTEPDAPGCSIAPRDDGKPVCDKTKCVYCTLCAKKCPQGAIEVDRAEKTWSCDYEACVACGVCATVCPKKAIEM